MGVERGWTGKRWGGATVRGAGVRGQGGGRQDGGGGGVDPCCLVVSVAKLTVEDVVKNIGEERASLRRAERRVLCVALLCPRTPGTQEVGRVCGAVWRCVRAEGVAGAGACQTHG